MQSGSRALATTRRWPGWYATKMAAAPPPTSTIRVRDELRQAIVDGRAGARERRCAPRPLAERCGTSRTPIREALLLLEREGLVEIEPHKGAVVRSFDADDLARPLRGPRARRAPRRGAGGRRGSTPRR